MLNAGKSRAEKQILPQRYSSGNKHQLLSAADIRLRCMGQVFTRTELVFTKGRYSLLLYTKRESFEVAGESWKDVNSALCFISEQFGWFETINLIHR